MAANGPAGGLGIDRRRLGNVLLVLGVVGVVLAGLVSVGLFRGAIAARDLDERINNGQQRVVTILTQMQGRLDLVATSFDNAGATLQTASQSLTHAGDVLNDLTSATNTLADALNINIFGNQPFGAAGEKLRALSDRVAVFQQDAAALGARINTNATNVTAVSGQVRTIRDQVADLATEVAAFDRTSEVMGLLLGAIVLGGLLVLWLAIAAAVCAWLGWKLRHAPTAAEVLVVPQGPGSLPPGVGLPR